MNSANVSLQRNVMPQNRKSFAGSSWRQYFLTTCSAWRCRAIGLLQAIFVLYSSGVEDNHFSLLTTNLNFLKVEVQVHL